MRSTTLPLFILTLAAVTSAADAGITSSWIGRSGGSWSISNNWTAGVPGTGPVTDAVITTGRNPLAVTQDGYYSIASLTIGAGCTLNQINDRDLSITGLVNNGLWTLSSAGSGTDVSKGSSKQAYTCAGTFGGFNKPSASSLCASGFQICTSADTIDLTKCNQDSRGFYVTNILSKRDKNSLTNIGCGAPGGGQARWNCHQSEQRDSPGVFPGLAVGAYADRPRAAVPVPHPNLAHQLPTQRGGPGAGGDIEQRLPAVRAEPEHRRALRARRGDRGGDADHPA